MSVFKDNEITDLGRQLLSKVHMGAIFTPTRIVIGSGHLPEGTTVKTVTGVIKEEKSLTLNKAKRLSDGTIVFGGIYNNTNVEKEFFFRELALYAKAVEEDGTETEEIPYSYGNAGDVAELMASYSADTLVERQIDIVIYLGGDAKVNLQLASGIALTLDEAKEHFVQKIGDTLTGNLTFKIGKSSCIPVEITDSGSPDGNLLKIGASADTIIGSGKSPRKLAAEKGIDGTGETLYLASDEDIKIYTNCENIEEAKEIIIDQDGRITVPTEPTEDMHLATRKFVQTLTDKLKEKIENIEENADGSISGEEGIHGFRYYNDEWQIYDKAAKKWVSTSPNIKTTALTLRASAWTAVSGIADLFQQNITQEDITSNVKANKTSFDCFTDIATKRFLQEQEVNMIWIENRNGTAVAFAEGAKPTSDIQLQVRILN